MRYWIAGITLACALLALSLAPGTAQQRKRAPKKASSGAKPAGPYEVEGYSGKLLANDVSFALHLNSDHSATADWAASPDKTSHLKGTYTGEEGVYVVTLKQDTGGNPLDAQTLTLYLKRMGGMEPGQFVADTSHAKRDIAGLQLTSIEGYKTKPGKIGRKTDRARSSSQRRGRTTTIRTRAIRPRLPRLP